jgi:hypothetical protein
MSRRRGICVTVVVAGALVSILLRLHVPMLLLPPSGSPHDDGLFLRGASYLAAGDWLGPFNNLTLAKGPAFPAFIAVMHWLRLPLMLGLQVTVVLAALALAACVWVVTRRDWPAAATFLIVALNPTNFSAQASRVIRDSWYASLSVLFIAVLFLAVYGAARGRRLSWAVPAGALAGLCGAAYWLCREEGPWIVPSVAILVVGLPLGLFYRWRRQPVEARPSADLLRRRGLRVGAVLLAALVGFGAPIELVRAENQSHYGAALTTDWANGKIARAYSDWTRVRAGTLFPRVPISHEQRLAVYAVSPAAMRLRSFLESKDDPWKAIQCAHTDPCDELTGAYMLWAIRDAAAGQGLFASEQSAQIYFGHLSDQIQAACNDGKLTCAARLPVSLQPFQRTSVSAFTSSFTGGLWDLVADEDLYSPLQSVPSIPQPERDQLLSLLAGAPATQIEADQEASQFTAGDWLYDALDFIYRVLVPLLTLLGLCGLGIALWRPSWPRAALAALCLALAVGVLVRTGLIALVDSAEFPAREPSYEFPSHAFLLAFGCVGAALLVMRSFSSESSM